MLQISNHIYCDATILSLPMQTRLMAHPYHDLPYLLIKGFLTPDEATQIAHSSRACDESVYAQVRTYKEGAIHANLDPSIRKTAIHTLNDHHLRLYHERLDHHRQEIEVFFWCRTWQCFKRSGLGLLQRRLLRQAR